MQIISKPLNLNGAKNVRDLGGYQTRDGQITKNHSLLRGDTLHNLTDKDCKTLYDYGIRCIIDLRSEDETSREPGRLHDLYNDIEYLHVPIQDHVRANRYSEEFPPSMWQLYCWLLDDSKESFRIIFETIAKYRDECVIFHCSGGKDRTGTIAMLLLMLAGVDDETIIGDYAVTQELMKEIFPKQLADLESRGLIVPSYIMESPPENMEKTLRYFYDNYHTIEEYFEKVGFKEDEIKLIRSKLVERT